MDPFEKLNKYPKVAYLNKTKNDNFLFRLLSRQSLDGASSAIFKACYDINFKKRLKIRFMQRLLSLK